MNACSVLQPAGSNQDCLVPLSEVKNLLICDKDLSFTFTGKDNLSNWETEIKQNLTIYAVAGLDSYDVTTDDPNIVTQPVKKSKKITNEPVPSFVAYLDANICDYKQMENTLRGGTYGIMYELQDGSIMGTIVQSGADIGKFKPLKATVNAIGKQFQEVDSTQAFRVYVNHINNDEFKNKHVFEPVWDTSALLDAMPVGLNMIMTSAYSAGSQTVNIKVRCGGNKLSLVVADFDADETQGNVDTPAVTTVVEDGAGNYTLTVQKDTVPVNLVDNDVAVIRVKVLSGSDVTHISNYVAVQGVT